MKILPLATTWMALRELSLILSEIQQTQKDKYHMISFIGGIQKTNKSNRNRLVKTKNKLVVARGD